MPVTGRRLEPLTLDSLPACRLTAAGPACSGSCHRWPPGAERAGDTEFEKEAWLSAALLDWGSVGRLAYVDDVPAGYLLYAPAHMVPRAVAFPTAPVSGDAVLLITVGRRGVHRRRHRPDARAGRGQDLTRRGVRAIEAFGLEHGTAPEGDRYSAAGGCLLPADFLRSVGFKTVRPHHRHPRLRLDLRTTLSWREDVEQAIERLLGTVRQPVLSGS